MPVILRSAPLPSALLNLMAHFVFGVGVQWAVILHLATPAPALGQEETAAAAVPAWTNLVVGKGWGTNTRSSMLAVDGTLKGQDTATRAELQRVLDMDDAAQAEADQLLSGLGDAQRAEGAASEEEVKLRVRSRFIAVRAAYQQFLTRHPDNVGGLLAYGSLLADLGDDSGAVEQWEKARAVAPNNPSTWNNLANHFAATDNELKAFSYYEKAISLATNRAIYERNLGSAIVHFRASAMRYYSLDEPKVLLKGLQLLRSAQVTLTNDFALATEIGQVLYAIRPPRWSELISAWRRALQLAGDETEGAGVRLHLARSYMLAGEPQRSRVWLDSVTNAAYSALRKQLGAELESRKSNAVSNAPPERRAAD